MADLFLPSQAPLPDTAQGRHMIEALDALVLHARSKRSRAWQEMGEMMGLFQNCIRAEAARADRAESAVAFYEANTNIRPPSASEPVGKGEG